MPRFGGCKNAIWMNQNAIPTSRSLSGRRTSGDEPYDHRSIADEAEVAAGLFAEADDELIARTTQRALAKRQAVYEEEVRRLLEAGLAVMRQCGTSRSPSVADIVDAAGLSRDAFYRHFASKEDLVAAIVEAGSLRLVSYLRHQMAKENSPDGQLRRWVEGIMSQAGRPDVSHSTRAVLWNGYRSRPSWSTPSDAIAALLVGPLTALGSRDPKRDSVAITHATMGVMRDFLWRAEAPTTADIAHLEQFVAATVR